MDRDELATLAGDSVDLQLHTHRHERVGDLSARQTEWLGELGIESATTTRHGFNYPDTPKMLLNRFLDSESISDIEFEAELCGFFETLRRFGIRIEPAPPGRSNPTASLEGLAQFLRDRVGGPVGGGGDLLGAYFLI